MGKQKRWSWTAAEKPRIVLAGLATLTAGTAWQARTAGGPRGGPGTHPIRRALH